MEKKTAVEQLQIWLNSHLSHEQQMQFEGLFQQAKELEKQQFLDLHIETMKDGLIHEGSKRWKKDYLPLIKSMAEKTWDKTFCNETND